MSKNPRNGTEAVAMAIGVFLEHHVSNPVVRDQMERCFFEPAPRRMMDQVLRPGSALSDVLDLGADLDAAFGLESAAPSVARMLWHLDVVFGQERLKSSERPTLEEKRLFRRLLSRSRVVTIWLPDDVCEPLLFRCEEVESEEVESKEEEREENTDNIESTKEGEIMRTYEITVHGKTRAGGLTGALVYLSQWFTVEPLPDDDYTITVKAENQEMLDQLNQLSQEKEKS